MKKVIILSVVLFILFINLVSVEKNNLLNVKASFLKNNKAFTTYSKLQEDTKSDMLQLKSGASILGFKSNEMYLGSTSHLLKVVFSGSNNIEPISEHTDKSKENGKVASLNKVTYNKLWDNIDLVYDKVNSAVYKTTYYIEPSAMDENPVDKIRLKYNVPVRINKGGQLVFSYETGTLTESKPIAWQDIDGKRIFIDVKYKQNGEKEIGFSVGNYDPNYKLIIDPILSWNTFVGGAGDEYGTGLAIDGSGNIYIAGQTNASWGSPVRAFSSSRTCISRASRKRIYSWRAPARSRSGSSTSKR